MQLINLSTWLETHSVKWESNRAEKIFTHISGETSILLLPPKPGTPIIDLCSEPLSSFYREFAGASIGNSQIFIGTNVLGGVQTSHDFILPDLHQITKTAEKLRMKIGRDEQAFMVEAAWMFVYTISTGLERSVIRKYDRDFGTISEVENVDKIFESWWEIVEADQ